MPAYAVQICAELAVLPKGWAHRCSVHACLLWS